MTVKGKRAGKRPRSLLEKQRVFGYLFIFPFIIGAACFILYPVILSVVFSFSEIQPNASGYTIAFRGVQNYAYLFLVDPSFRRTLVDTLKSTLVYVPVVVIFSFFIASMLNQPFRGRTAARSILFLPLILSSGAVMNLASGDMIHSAMENKQGIESAASGNLSEAFAANLSELPISPSLVSFLVSCVDNISGVLAMSAIPIIIFLAGLQSISPSIYEASFVEGATKWEVFWKISLPMISPLILVTVVYSVVDSFTSVDNQVMAGIRELCFQKFNFGLGSAMAWVYLLIVLAILTVLYLVINRFVFYYDK